MASEPAFEGESSWSRQTVEATLSAEVSATETNEGGNSQSSEILASLSALKSLLQSQTMASGTDNLHFPRQHQQQATIDESLPPMQFVLSLLRKVKGRSTSPNHKNCILTDIKHNLHSFSYILH